MLVVGGVALVTTVATLPLLVPLLRRARILDYPGAHSSHREPTPRGAGVALAAAAVLAVTTAGDLSGASRTGLLVTAAGLGLVGLAEDVRGVPVLCRLVLQGVVATAGSIWLLADGTGEPIRQLAIGAGTVLWMVAFANCFNFMDGINGISAVQAIIAGTTWSVIGTAREADALATGGIVLAMLGLGFLPFNFPRARVFLGDAGSYFLGGWAAAVVVIGLRAGLPVEAVVAPVLLYCVDTGVALSRRVLRGERWFEPHHTHVYQRLVEQGWSHGQTVALVGAVIAACSALGLAGLQEQTGLRIAAASTMALILVAYLFTPSMRKAPR